MAQVLGRSRWRRQLPLLLVITLALAGGVVLIVRGVQSHEPAAAPLPSATFNVPAGELPAVALPPLETRPLDPGQPPPAVSDVRPGCTVAVQPAHLVIGSLCLNGRIELTGTTSGGALDIPPDVHTIGMWDDGAPLVGAGAQPLTQGTTLLAGHVNDFEQGNGTLYDLYKVAPGAVVYASDAAGHLTRWRVVAQSVVVKEALPRSVFAGPTGPRQLVLVTCGGPIVNIPGYGNTYRDNVIVTAVPA